MLYNFFLFLFLFQTLFIDYEAMQFVNVEHDGWCGYHAISATLGLPKDVIFKKLIDAKHFPGLKTVPTKTKSLASE